MRVNKAPRRVNRGAMRNVTGSATARSSWVREGRATRSERKGLRARTAQRGYTWTVTAPAIRTDSPTA